MTDEELKGLQETLAALHHDQRLAAEVTQRQMDMLTITMAAVRRNLHLCTGNMRLMLEHQKA